MRPGQIAPPSDVAARSESEAASEVDVVWLPAAPYVSTWETQQQRAAALARGDAPETLYLVEHLSVYTLGYRTDPAHLLEDEAALRRAGADVVRVDRGGDVTWHGPGQITGYPILDLNRRHRDLHAYVRSLEQVLVDVAGAFGIDAGRASGMPGVWVGDEKLAAIGVKVLRGWVTVHGFALNVCPSLSWYDRIVPCGLHGYGVTSLERVLGRRVTLDEAVERLIPAFETRFAARAVWR